MINGSNQLFDKHSSEGVCYAKMPTDLTHYLYVPGFRGDLAYLYALIVDYYNADYGYAFPTQDQLALKTGKSTQSVRADMRRLKQAGLIRILTFEGRNNYGYVPLVPLGQAELWRECPEAAERYREAIAKLDEEKRANREKQARKRGGD
ncbi:helix-turn-helix domain-containing protein [Shouchella patagoniensis]|uniref:helix-turn-helix domain-containing protein n=1 Tax=Shouchella patagoniensis TaxID=228576 RepID=UPI00099594FD|nr:helix-turn-helix domain-containing protein [Shouchella patagoniensis]